MKYHRHDSDWNAERLFPELNEMRMATSTGTSDHRMYSHVMVARPNGMTAGTVALHVATARWARTVTTR